MRSNPDLVVQGFRAGVNGERLDAIDRPRLLPGRLVKQKRERNTRRGLPGPRKCNTAASSNRSGRLGQVPMHSALNQRCINDQSSSRIQRGDDAFSYTEETTIAPLFHPCSQQLRNEVRLADVQAIAGVPERILGGPLRVVIAHLPPGAALGAEPYQPSFHHRCHHP